MEIKTTLEIWKEIDLVSLPFDITNTKSATENGVRCREFFFTSQKTEGGDVRVFCRLSKRLSDECPPVAVLSEGLGANLFARDISVYLDAGFAVLQFDYCGYNEDAPRYTLYPKTLDYCNYNKNPAASELIMEDITKSCWYNWSIAALRACVLLREIDGVDCEKLCFVGFGVGGTFAIKAAALIPAVRSAIIKFNGCAPFNGTDNESLIMSLAFGTRSFAPHIKCPVLFELAGNESDGSFDKMCDVYEKTAQLGKRLSISHSKSSAIDEAHKQNEVLWLDSVINNREFPRVPTIEYSVSHGALYYSVTVDSEFAATKTDIYFAAEALDPAFRYWSALKTERAGENVYIARAAISNPDEPCYAFATTAYADGSVFSSPLFRLVPKTIGVDASPKTTSRLVYDGDMKIDGWLVMNNAALERGGAALATGPFGIDGVTSAGGELVTFKIGDERFRGKEGNILQLSVFSPLSQRLTFKIRDSQGKVYTDYFDIEEASNWTKITLSAEDFKGQGGLAWQDAISLSVEFESPIIINNLLWV